MNPRLTPSTVLLLLLPPILWAGNAVVGRMVAPLVPPATLNFLRWLLAGLLLLPMAGWLLRPGSGLVTHWRRFALLGLLGVGLYNALQYLALKTSTPINVTLVASSMPVFMLVLGALYAAGSLLVLGIVQLVGDSRPATAAAAGAAGAAGTPAMDPLMLLALVLHTPLFLMFWHAPALVHWHGVTPVKSLFFSLVACLRNIGAFAVFGLLWMAVFSGVGLVFSLVLGLIAGPQAVGTAMLPLALIMAAMFSSSLWFTFRDCFTPDAPQAPSAPAPTDLPRSSGDAP